MELPAPWRHDRSRVGGGGCVLVLQVEMVHQSHTPHVALRSVSRCTPFELQVKETTSLGSLTVGDGVIRIRTVSVTQTVTVTQ
jgi:hypothetical protein